MFQSRMSTASVISTEEGISVQHSILHTTGCHITIFLPVSHVVVDPESQNVPGHQFQEPLT
jgi:hypothetical protein